MAATECAGASERSAAVRGRGALPPAVIVVGGAGMLGRVIVKRMMAAKLADGTQAPQVVSLDLRPSPAADASVCADLKSPQAIEELLFRRFEVKSLVLAVKPPLAGPSYQDYVELLVSSVCDLIRLAEKYGVGQVVYVSSIAASDHWVPHVNCSESDPEATPPLSQLRSPYDLSKAIAEDFILQRHRPDGMRTVALRVAGIYGGAADPYPSRRIPGGFSVDNFVDCPKIDHNHADNVAGAVLRALEVLRDDASVGGRFYFYTHGDRFNDQQEMSEMLAKRTGRIHIKVPWWLVRPFLRGAALAQSVPLMVPSCPRRQPGGGAIVPRSHFVITGMWDCGFINQTYDNSLFRKTFGYSHVYTVEESVEVVARQEEEEEAARKQSAATASGGTVSPAVATGLPLLPLCLCLAAMLVVSYCSGMDGPAGVGAELSNILTCPGGMLRDPEVLRLANACILLSAPVTHIVGSVTRPSYRLWQPFRGGALHVLLQGVGWTLFSLLCIQWIVTTITTSYQPVDTGGVWRAVLGMDDQAKAASGVLSQILLGLSLFAFKGHMREKSA